MLCAEHNEAQNYMSVAFCVGECWRTHAQQVLLAGPGKDNMKRRELPQATMFGQSASRSHLF
jgi:hypothetical protein